MLTLWGSRQRFCDGITRRSFLKIGAFGAGLTLADMLRPSRWAPPRARRSSNKSAIMIYLPGGPSHMDMYDLKPDAPDGVPRRVQADRHQRARRADLRALAAAGPHVGQAGRRPLARRPSTSTPTRWS